MNWTESGSDSAVVNASARTVNDCPYRVIDLGDGAATLQIDIEAPWSTVLQILKTITPSGPEANTNGGRA
jgi:hypothetical protein